MISFLKKIFTWWNRDTFGTNLKTLLTGKLKGEDSFGNKYYENKKGDRWVIYFDEIDASKIPTDWYSWMHHTPNVLENNQNPNKFTWQKPHKPNLTGTKEAYYPNKDKDEPEKKYKSWLN